MAVIALAGAARARCGAGDLKQAAAIIAQLERAPRIRDNFKYPSLLPELVRTASPARSLSWRNGSPKG